MAIQISTEKKYDRKQLKVIYVEDNEFIPLFNHKSFVDSTRNNKIIRYILGKYERFTGGTREVNLDGSIDTIEHILPQNPDETWGDDYNFDYLIYRLGNLCLLEKAYNNELKNKSYTDKAIIYNKSAFVSTKQIPNEYSVWNETAINNRQQKMGNCAKSIWKIDF